NDPPSYSPCPTPSWPNRSAPACSTPASTCPPAPSAGWPATRRSSRLSSVVRGSRWTSGGPTAPSPARYAGPWCCVTAGAPFLLAISRLNGAMYTIGSIGSTVVRPPCTTWSWSAPRTMTPRTTPAGRSASPPTASPNGYHQPTLILSSAPDDNTDINHRLPHHPNNYPGDRGGQPPHEGGGPGTPTHPEHIPGHHPAPGTLTRSPEMPAPGQPTVPAAASAPTQSLRRPTAPTWKASTRPPEYTATATTPN